MKIKYGLLLVVLPSLAACTSSETARVNQERPISSSVTSSVSSSEESAISTTTSVADLIHQPVFNGSYYSVQGKYGDVIIVNKKYPISSDYAPGEIPEAASAFHHLLAEMVALGYDVSTTAYSGFRSYETQAALYQAYVANDSQENADRYSARPGHSEHQTGLAYDILDSSGALLTEETASQWLAENAHRYGFIVRYPPDKEEITGYMPESWHLRYIGPEAVDIYQSGQTLEEYFDIQGGSYVE